MVALVERVRSLPSAAVRHADQFRRGRLALLRSGARRLLEQIEWDVERVLHMGRLVLWTGLLLLMVFVLNASPGAMLASMISTGVALLTGSDPGLRVEPGRSEEHTSELQSRLHLVCRLLLE